MIWAVIAVFAVALFVLRVASAWPGNPADELQWAILLHGVLPRAAVALLSGAALGLAGFLLQQVLRNPLADPSTLGISAGAQLFMAIATVFAPGFMAWSATSVALAGGLAAAGLTLSLTWRGGLEPVSVALVGMMSGLIASAVSAALILAEGDYLFSLLIWGGGSLVQQNWDAAIAVAVVVAAGAAATLCGLRPLAVMGLDDVSARNLGVSPLVGRLLLVGVAVAIASTVTAQVGVIGFVGLAAPALATLSGARAIGQRLIGSLAIGGLLLWLTDGLIQVTATAGGDLLPAGAATALLGGPLLLWLLPRLRGFGHPIAPAFDAPAAGGHGKLVLLVAAGAVAVAVSLSVGREPNGLTLDLGETFSGLSAWRWPRIAAAGGAGALVAMAGVLVQRLTANPLASPEVLGASMGAGAGLMLIVLIDVTASFAWQLGGSAAGAIIALAVILFVAARSGFGADRILLGGVAVAATCSAAIAAVVAMGNTRSYIMLRWLTGSVNEANEAWAGVSLAALAILLAASLLLRRWLDILPLGQETARSVGVPVAAPRAVILLLAAASSAIAAAFIGPLSFVGLQAPHLARLVGFRRAAPQLLAAASIGAILMILSDWLARIVIFPYQFPTGLFACLLGGPYFVFMLTRSRSRA